MMILHIILKIKNKVKFLIDLLNPCYTTSKHLYTISTLRVYSYIHTRKKLSLGLGMDLIHIPKTQIWWASYPDPSIPMKPRFGGFRGYEKMGFEIFSQTQFFSGVNVWVYYSKFQRKSRAVWRGICAKMFDL